MESASADGFYRDLAAFDDFDGFAEFEAYDPVPDDWLVVIGDVEGSTAAIAAGRYKAVNMVGAGVITAILNALPDLDLPFVFGGDGGTVLVPARHRATVRATMAGLQRAVTRDHGLGLRAATVPVARLRAEGLDVRVRKFRLSPGNHLAMLAGGGAERADAILKAAAPGDPDIVRMEESDAAPDLEGLSCRWEPLKPRLGRMIALIVQPMPGAAPEGVLHDSMAGIAECLSDPIAAHAPVSDRSLRFRFPPRGLMLEARVLARGGLVALAWLRAITSAALQALAECFALRIGPYDQPRYRGELKANTDFRKFDDSLRVVLDVTPVQAEAIERHFEERYRAGALVYGLHIAEQALMTCLVFRLEDSRHVHFVDVDDGGFARAAEGLKRRRAAIRQAALAERSERES